MKIKSKEQQVKAELKHYFDCARNQKCPSGMEQNLYEELQISTKNSTNSWWSPRFAMAGLSMLFVSVVIFNVSNNHIQQEKLDQAQTDLHIAMHYMNRVTLKSLSSVNNKGLKPGLIIPLSRSVASL